jgi:hypothetical protein
MSQSSGGPEYEGAGGSSFCMAMKPITKSLAFRAMSSAAWVYAPAARVPSELISARRRRPRPRGRPTDARPPMIEGPGTGCALVMWDQEDIRWTPREYCKITVLPKMSIIGFKKSGFIWIRSIMREVGERKCSLTDISEFPIFEDEEIMLLTECYQLVDQVLIEILDNIDMRL